MPDRWNWPAFRCVAIDDSSGRVCQSPAIWRANPLPRSRAWWTYCDQHKPEGAFRIPIGARYHVTRVTVTVAIASMLEHRQEATAEAASLLTNALDGIGAALVHLRVHGAGPAKAKAKAHGLRLMLAGPRKRVTAAPWPLDEDENRPVWVEPRLERFTKARRRAQAARSTAAAGNGTSALSSRPTALKRRLNGSRVKAAGE